MAHKVKVTRVNINDFWSELSSDSPVVDELRAVVAKSDEEQQYCFEAKFPFGAKIIRDGRSCLLTPTYDKADWVDSFGSLTEEAVHAKFRADCHKSTDHPLSVVLDDEVEIYSWRNVEHLVKPYGGVVEELRFPLKRLSKGGWFGVFGTADMIVHSENPVREVEAKDEPTMQSANIEAEGSPWAAVAGRKCVLFSFPPPIKNTSKKLRDSFHNVFPNAPESYLLDVYSLTLNEATDVTKRVVERFQASVYKEYCHLINDQAKDGWTTRILIVPEHYFVIEGDDKEDLKAAKRGLQRRLLLYGWEQSEDSREALWRQRAMSGDPNIHGIGPITVRNHLIDVLNDSAFCFRPIHPDDSLLFKGWMSLLERWTRYGLWDEACFPLMLTYGKGVPQSKLPSVVLPQFIPLNISAFSARDLSNVLRLGSTIATDALRGSTTVSCVHHPNNVPMAEKFWGQYTDILGDVELASYTDRNGDRVTKRIRNGNWRHLIAGSLMSYFDNAFLLQRR